MITKILKTILSDVRRTVIGVIVLALFGGTTGVLYLSKTALDFSIAIINIPTPLWATFAVVLLLGVYIHLRSRRPRLPSGTFLHQALGVLWDNDLNMHCLSCGAFLKNSTLSPSIFFCAHPGCNSKHVLKDDSGKELTKQEALNILKSANNGIQRIAAKPGSRWCGGVNAFNR